MLFWQNIILTDTRSVTSWNFATIVAKYYSHNANITIPQTIITLCYSLIIWVHYSESDAIHTAAGKLFKHCHYSYTSRTTICTELLFSHALNTIVRELLFTYSLRNYSHRITILTRSEELLWENYYSHALCGTILTVLLFSHLHKNYSYRISIHIFWRTILTELLFTHVYK